MLKFSKQKCRDRLEREGLLEHVSSKELLELDKLDGCPASQSIFSQRILFESFLFCNGRDGVGYYVRAEDCE